MAVQAGLVSVSEMGDTMVRLFIIFSMLAGVTGLIALWSFYQFFKNQRR